jgi:hypothetical protein
MSMDRTQAEIARIVTEIVTESLTRIMPLVSSGMRAPSYECTGQKFGCDTYYICDNNNHSCKTDSSFTCGGNFSCTGGAFGIVLEAR